MVGGVLEARERFGDSVFARSGRNAFDVDQLVIGDTGSVNDVRPPLSEKMS